MVLFMPCGVVMRLESQGIFISFVFGLATVPTAVMASDAASTSAPRPAAPAPVTPLSGAITTPADANPNPPVDVEDSESIDDRFAIEGYLGFYGSLLQQTVPTVGLTGSVYVDDEIRFGADISRGQSKALFGDFKTQGGSVWLAMEMADSLWLKGGVSYTRLDKPTSQEPMSVLLEGENKKNPGAAVRNDFLGLDVAFGQMWVFPRSSISVDYAGFTLPALRLTGPKLPLFGVQVARAEWLYNFE